MKPMRWASCRYWGQNLVTRLESRTISLSSSRRKSVEIPARVERGPTDILRAISDTAPPNHNAYHYKYIDDQYFRPVEVHHKVDFAMAREWGKRAAEFVQSEHLDLFEKPFTDSKIPAYNPAFLPTTKDEVSEDLLRNAIANGEIQLAMTIYRLLEEDVSVKSKIALLELFCYSNSREPSPDETYSEYRYYVLKPQLKVYREWVQSPTVDKLFDDLIKEDPNTVSAAYNALISGMMKHGNGFNALKLYEKCREEKIQLHVNTYNELLKKIEYLSTVEKERIALFNALLRNMLQSSVRPDATTLASCIRGIVILYPGAKCKDLVKSLLRLFTEKFKVKRSLGSYYFELCSIVESAESPEQDIADDPSPLVSIFQEVAGRSFEIQDAYDFDFFAKTMAILSEDLNNADYALILHEIFSSNGNERFIGNTKKATQYYESLLSVVLKNKPLSEFGRLYKQIVPYTHAPTVNFTSMLLNKLMNQEPAVVGEYLPNLLRTTVQQRLWKFLDVYSSLTELMLSSCKSEGSQDLHEICAANSWGFYQYIARDDSESLTSGDGSLEQCLVNCILVLLYAKQPTEALSLVNRLSRVCTRSGKRLAETKITMMLDVCISQRLHEHGIAFLEYLVGCEHPSVVTCARKLNRSLPLDSHEKQKLETLVGRKALQT